LIESVADALDTELTVVRRSLHRDLRFAPAGASRHKEPHDAALDGLG
jgi:hypothetical protein